MEESLGMMYARLDAVSSMAAPGGSKSGACSGESDDRLSTVEEEPPWCAEDYDIGDLVVVHGLLKSVELNGKPAQIVQRTSSERLGVRLIGSREVKSIRAQNLRIMSEEERRWDEWP